MLYTHIFKDVHPSDMLTYILKWTQVGAYIGSLKKTLRICDIFFLLDTQNISEMPGFSMKN